MLRRNQFQPNVETEAQIPTPTKLSHPTAENWAAGRDGFLGVCKAARFLFTCKLFAFLGSPFTGISAFLAMLDVVRAAFRSTGATGLCAETANCRRKLRIGAHQQRCCAAKHGAISVQLNAAGHHFHVVFSQTSAGAISAFVRAVIAGFDAINVSLVWHIFPFVAVLLFS